MEYLLSVWVASFMGCNQNIYPVYCQINNNKPGIDRTYAIRISSTVRKMEKKYQIPPKVLSAILMQESSYRLQVVGNSGRTKDYGISQINQKTAQRYGFDVTRLMNDLEYSIEAGAIVLHWFMKNFKHKEKDWYARYNCGSGGSVSRDTCQEYKKKVEKYL